MKNINSLLIATVVLLSSCSTHYCDSRPITVINISSGGTITDTHAIINKCGKGDLSNIVSTQDCPIVSEPYNTPTLSHARIGYDFTDDGYDYEITLLPSGRDYKVTEIRYGREKWKGGWGGGHGTKCSFYYNLNGKEQGSASYEEDGTGGNNGWLMINY